MLPEIKIQKLRESERIDFDGVFYEIQMPQKPKRNQNMSKVEKSLFKMNVKRGINEHYDAEAANQYHSNRPISRKCQWTFLIVFLVQGLACCCLIPLL